MVYKLFIDVSCEMGWLLRYLIYRVLIKYDPFVWIFLPHLNTILTSEEFNPAHPYTTFSLPFLGSLKNLFSLSGFYFPFFSTFLLFPSLPYSNYTLHPTQNKTKKKKKKSCQLSLIPA